MTENPLISKVTYITQDKETDEFGHVRLGGIGQVLAREMEKILNIETRTVMLGHVQRGGRPSAYDRNLSTLLGYEAVLTILNARAQDEPVLAQF